MQKKQFIISIIIFVFNHTAFSQTIVKGTVKDKNNIIIQANVIAFDTVLNKIKSYSTVSKTGDYRLSLPQKEHYELRVSYLGYKTAIVPIYTEKKDTIKKNIILDLQEYEIENVEITYTQPIKINGDTITYDANSFSTGNEKKLGDILENLPGVEVSKNGEIKIKGKTVSKIMVDNKEFFSGDTKLACRNIPSNIIDKIQVLNNYNEVGMMKGVNAGNNNPVINIKLKQGKKKFWFGDIEAGGGIKNKYLLNPNLFFYSPKTSVNFIGNVNNTAKQSFTFNDYIRFSGGISNIMNGSNGTFSMNTDELGFLFLPNNKAKEINPKFGALNINHNFSKKLSLSGFAIVNLDDIKMQENTFKSYFADYKSENTSSVSNINSLFSLYNLRLNYQPNYKIYLDYNLYGKYSNSDFENNLNSNILGKTSTKKGSAINNLKQNFKLYYSAEDNGIASLNISHKYFNSNLNTYFNSDKNNLHFPSFTETSDLHFRQTKAKKGNEFNVIAEYIYLINKQNNIRINIGNEFLASTLLPDIKQFANSENTSSINNYTFENPLNKYLKYYFSSLKYKTVINKLTASAGVKFHHFISENKQHKKTSTDKQTTITPDIYLKYSFMNAKNISFTYNASPKFVEISKLSETFSFANYNNIEFGNSKLKASLYHNLSFNYLFFNNFSFSNTHWIINYSREINPEGISYERTKNIYLTKYLQFEKPKQTASSNFNYEKRIYKFKLKFNNTILYSDYENKTNSILIKQKLFTHSYKLSFSTYFKDTPNFELGTKQSFNIFEQNKTKSNYYNSYFFANIEVPFLKQFIFLADYSYDFNRNIKNLAKNNYSFLNANLYYKTKNKVWEFSVSGKNILNTKFITEINNNDLFLFNSNYYVQERIILFSLVYKL